ncbi:hypothetical protein DUNSADRAFT_6585 [Dunaliella salina]|uniref:Potassium channel tetramerisation-type BTB domain-containing protein n=1 Tax=Dunaliella salina TaxID=3046 RepID=A0ABQ7GN38_DUNSA|nr:hypothetical protein DUNSADRAFT_6585 [Dunaliella salina]|eukprot:KAF5836015.1 hypothetical protein DUNSADRAFT_6585 [Dunaliella salina]
MSPAQPVQFNVGGVKFFTTKETILKEPTSKLAAALRTQPGPDGCYFLDRDPKHFQLLLNWLRDGWCSIPHSIEGRRELSAEVKHYGLISMDLWLRSQSHAENMSDAAAAAASSAGGLGAGGLGSGGLGSGGLGAGGLGAGGIGGRWSSGGAEGLLGPQLRGALGQGVAATAAAMPVMERPWSAGMGQAGGSGASSPYSAVRPSALSRGSRSFGVGGGLSWAEQQQQQQQQQHELGGLGVGMGGGGGGLGGLFGNGRASGVMATPGPMSAAGGVDGMGQLGVLGSAAGGGGGVRPWLATPSVAATPLQPTYPVASTPSHAPPPSYPPPFTPTLYPPPQPGLNPAPTPQRQPSLSARPPIANQLASSLPRPMSTPSYSYALGGGEGGHLNGAGVGQQGLVTPGLMPTPHALSSGAGPLGLGTLQQQQQQQQQQMQVMAPPGGAVGNGSMAVGVPGSTPAVRKQAFRDALHAATTPPPQPGSVLSHGLPSQGEVAAAGGAGTGSKWTAKYLKNPEVHEVVNTLLELAFSGPHPALRAGKVVIHITPGPCDHKSGSSVIPGGLRQQLRGKLMAVRVHNMGSGWSCEFPIRPNCDVTLFDKFSGLAEMVQENWFVLCAILKDQFGVLLAEDHSATSAAKPLPMSDSLLGSFGSSNGNGTADGQAPATKPSCQMCKRATLAITLHKVV